MTQVVSAVLIGIMGRDTDYRLLPGESVRGWWPDNGEPGPVPLSLIPSILAHADGWVEFEGRSRYGQTDNEDRPDWLGDAEPSGGPWYRSVVTIYGRGVATVSVCHEEVGP